MVSPAAAAAMASLYAKNRMLVDRSFNHMTHDALQSIDRELLSEYESALQEQSNTSSSLHKALAQALIRHIAYRYLNKYSRLLSAPDVVEDALKYYTLPEELQQQLTTKYAGESSTPPTTWYEALHQLKEIATTNGVLDQGKLWRLILEHPMTSYAHVQCQACGHMVLDQYPLQQTDDEEGLRELPPTGDELELRAGWFRGPRKEIVFELTCPSCQHVSIWYRSGHPKVLLNPNKWGRLCGDQEDLRLTLAEYLKVPVRLVVPLDWDHVWSEYKFSSSWEIEDGSARNFACRLDEGIGSWTRVWSIHPHVSWCQDVTQEYLKYKSDGGRADNRKDEKYDEMNRYKQIVQRAQNDETGELTQAKTCNGFILARAQFTYADVTRELQRAAEEYGKKEWWDLYSTTN